MISYLELLQMVKNGNAPDLIYLHLNCGKAYYQMYYDGGEFDYYGICDENDEDENFKYYLADTLLESQMIEENIEIIEEPEITPEPEEPMEANVVEPDFADKYPAPLDPLDFIDKVKPVMVYPSYFFNVRVIFLPLVN